MFVRRHATSRYSEKHRRSEVGIASVVGLLFEAGVWNMVTAGEVQVAKRNKCICPPRPMAHQGLSPGSVATAVAPLVHPRRISLCYCTEKKQFGTIHGVFGLCPMTDCILAAFPGANRRR